MCARVWLVGCFILSIGALNATAFGCVVTSTRIVFSGMGTRTAWYCKATEEEKQQAIEAIKKSSCVPDQIRESGRAIAATEALDFIPYWYTKAEAETAGPILDCHLTLRQATNESGVEHFSGVRAMANGRRILASPAPEPGHPPATPRYLGIQFTVTDTTAFERDCPATGCTELLHDLCPHQ